MASGIAETAKLIASLGFKDNFTPGAKKAMRSLGQLETTGFRVGQQVGKGLSNAATNIKRIGLVSAAGIGIAVHQGIESLAELEDAETSVAAAIKQTGKTGQVTAAQVADWANKIESSVGAAFDDKEITQAATTLIRFGKVTTANLKPALVVMTDLATKTGSVDSAASLLAKALADPNKAAGKLARTGVILTKEQQKQIAAFVKAGKVGKAQKVILDSLAKSTKGAAAASQGPYRRSLSVLADVTEDAERALAVGFLPVIEKVSKILSTELAKPDTLKNIKGIGEALAGGLDQLIAIATKLPWSAIGDAFKLAGAGGKALLDAFTGLPPWVQTAVLTGWGLNKLTGGALGGIVGELGKGLIKGVLGMNAGVVNINAGVVNGAGGVPGVAGAGGKGLLGTAASFILPVTIAGITVAAAGVLGDAIDPGGAAARNDPTGAHGTALGQRDPRRFNQNGQVNQNFIPAVVAATARYLDRGGRTDIKGANPNNILDKGSRDEIGNVKASVDTWGSNNVDEAAAIHASVDKSATAQTGAVNAAKFATVAASYGAAAIVAGAVRANPPPIVNVAVSVTPTQIEKTTTIVQRAGPTTGSSGGGGGGGAIKKP